MISKVPQAHVLLPGAYVNPMHDASARLTYAFAFNEQSGNPVSLRETDTSNRFPKSTTGTPLFEGGGWHVNPSEAAHWSDWEIAPAFGSNSIYSVMLAYTFISTSETAPYLAAARSSFADGMWALNGNNVGSSDDIVFAWYNSGFQSVSWSGAWPGTGYHQLVVTRFTGGVYELFVDGESWGTDTDATAQTYSANHDIAFGVLEQTGGLRADMICHAFYWWSNRRLTQSNVSQLWDDHHLPLRSPPAAALATEPNEMSTGQTLCIFTPASNQPPTSNFATLDVRNGHPVLDFDATTNESAIFSAMMPRNYGGGGVTVYIHYAMTSATSGNVDWDVAWERIGDQQQDIDSDDFAAVNSVDDTTVPGTSGNVDIVNVTFTDGADMDSVAVGELFRLKVTRDAASDTATGDAELLLVELKET